MSKKFTVGEIQIQNFKPGIRIISKVSNILGTLMYDTTSGWFIHCDIGGNSYTGHFSDEGFNNIYHFEVLRVNNKVVIDKDIGHYYAEFPEEYVSLGKEIQYEILSGDIAK